MNCCDRLLLIFVVFAFFQYQLRWNRDAVVASKPWRITARHSNGPVVHPKQCTVMGLVLSETFGNPPFRVDGNSILSEQVTTVGTHVYVNISAPPLSEHRVTLIASDSHFRDITLRCSSRGRASGDLYIPFLQATSISVEYCFDGIWDVAGHSVVSVELGIHSSCENDTYI
jgi:hypothetical protein